MEQVYFTPVGIALKQHELYGLDDNLLQEQAMFLRSNIIAWAQQHFILNDQQLNWLFQQDSSFTVDFAVTISNGLLGRYDFDIRFGGSEIWKSKRIDAKADLPFKKIKIFVERKN
ncbi:MULTISPECIES: hypothetical protein [Sphingobacterium]|uniref:hypothetical protein n=1 Tax=Sphingobacterium TaxID=28453 RepID=UPI0013E4C71B|nr:hypothetical protein [Sphingobacterium sp. DR205]QIH33504.1 hypothetical protein G6053_11670 [Sphingobacterium sp. DR205]